MAYHVTLASNIPSIMRDGIIPAIGENSLACGESEARVYAFINREELVSALLNWLGELLKIRVKAWPMLRFRMIALRPLLIATVMFSLSAIQVRQFQWRK